MHVRELSHSFRSSLFSGLQFDLQLRSSLAILGSNYLSAYLSTKAHELTLVKAFHVNLLLVDLGSQMLGVSGQLRSVALEFVEFSSPLDVSFDGRDMTHKVPIVGDSSESSVDTSNLDLELISSLRVVDYQSICCSVM